MEPTSKPPLTFAQQELAMARVVMTARGWTITDAREDGDNLTIIATRKLNGKPLTILDITRDR